MVDVARDLVGGFERAWVALGAEQSTAPDVLELIQTSYGESTRHYHNLSHVVDCLKMFELVESLAEHPHEVRLAIWFHDVIYDPTRSYNEKRSAALATELLDKSGAQRDAIQRIATLILSTAKHAADLEGDAAILSDVDLSILGAAPTQFQSYEMAIEMEYSFVPTLLFRAARKKFKRGMLSRNRIFHTEQLHEMLEAQARENLGAPLKAKA